MTTMVLRSLILSLSLAVSLQAASFTYDFDDGETDFTNTFSLNSGNMNYSTTGGVDGTGAVTPQGGSSNNSALLNTAAGTFADNGDVLTASLYFRPRDGNVNQRTWVGYATAGGDFATGDYISATVNGGGAVGANASLVIRGRQDGITGGSAVDSYVGTIDGLNNVWSNELFGGFQNTAPNDGPAGSGGLAVDHFSAVIPEPGTLALVGLTGFALMMIRRRKR